MSFFKVRQTLKNAFVAVAGAASIVMGLDPAPAMHIAENGARLKGVGEFYWDSKNVLTVQLY